MSHETLMLRMLLQLYVMEMFILLMDVFFNRVRGLIRPFGRCSPCNFEGPNNLGNYGASQGGIRAKLMAD